MQEEEAEILAGQVLTEKSALLALHQDLVNNDPNAYDSDLAHAGATAESEDAEALFKACG